jgi:phosphohistidine swiveling domain-containing protein
MNTKIARTKKWHKQQTEGTPYFIYGPCRGCVQWFKSDRVAWFCKHTEARAYLDQKYMLELAVLYTNRERKQRGYIKKLYNNWQKQIALKSKELFSEIDALQIKNISDRDLLKINNNIAEQSFKMYDQFFMDIYDFDADTLMNKYLVEENISLKSKEKETMVMQNKYIVHQLEERDLLRISKLIISNKKAKADLKKIRKIQDIKLLDKYLNISSAINKYQANYFWTRNSWAHTTFVSKMQIIKSLQHLVFEVSDVNQRLARLENYKADIRKQKKSIIHKHSMSIWLKDFFQLMALLTLWRDDRKAEMQKTNHYLEYIGTEIARRSKIKWTDINTCDPLAIKSIPVSNSLIKKHHNLFAKKYVLLWNGSKVVHCSAEKSKKLLNIFEASFKADSTKVNGMVACQGKVTAKVVVIDKKSEFKKMTKGAILVANNTRPDYVPLMKRAGAIVTNEGGITSHAAIVSRELGVPCVIGTKVATKVFKDGDLVEVIATHQGTVKKL